MKKLLLFITVLLVVLYGVLFVLVNKVQSDRIKWLELKNKEITRDEIELSQRIISDSELKFGEKIYLLTGVKWDIEKATIEPTKELAVSNVFFTSYNPEVGQTDSSPCIGANGTNLCELNKNGIRTIALSQDLVGRASWKRFKYGERVYLESETPQCSGIWQIEDTMNARYVKRGDLFQLTRKMNTSCWANIYKLKNLTD